MHITQAATSTPGDRRRRQVPGSDEALVGPRALTPRTLLAGLPAFRRPGRLPSWRLVGDAVVRGPQVLIPLG